jgi:hypothetical protein
MARLAGEIAAQAGTAEALAAVQRRVLLPLELDSLAGHDAFTCANDLIAYLSCRLPASEFQPSGQKSGTELGHE